MEKYYAAIEKQCERAGNTTKTAEDYKKKFRVLWNELGEGVFDTPTFTTHVAQYAPNTKKKHANVVAAALKGIGAPFSKVEEFGRLARSLATTVDSLEYQISRAQEQKEKLETAGDLRETLTACIAKAESEAVKGTYLTKKGVEKGHAQTTIDAWRSFVIDCKIRLATVPTRSDLCLVYASKEKADAAGGDCYYDSEAGKIVFGTRVKDPHHKKPSPDFDVSVIKSELDEHVKHGHSKLLGFEKANDSYLDWVGRMTKKFSGKGIRINSTLQRGMFWNQPENKTPLEETNNKAEMAGHTQPTAHKYYRNALLGKENGKKVGIDAEGNNCQNTNSDDITEPPAKRICNSPYAPTRPCYTFNPELGADDSQPDSDTIPKICVCWGTEPSCGETGKCNV